jgi:hypothetical protein
VRTNAILVRPRTYRCWSRIALLGAALALPALVLASSPAHAQTARHGRPECVYREAPFPGGNGSDYSHIPGGVYGWTITFPHPLTIQGHSYKGYIYAGSSNNLKRRKADWKRYWDKHGVLTKGYKLIWHVLTRDWDTTKFGDTPGKLGIKKTRLGAEQIAIGAFDAWGRHNHYKLFNKINAVGKNNPQRDDILNAGAELLEQQMENNAKAGTGPKDGDPLNYGDELPPEAIGGMPGGGGAWHCL